MQQQKENDNENTRQNDTDGSAKKKGGRNSKAGRVRYFMRPNATAEELGGAFRVLASTLNSSKASCQVAWKRSINQAAAKLRPEGMDIDYAAAIAINTLRAVEKESDIKLQIEKVKRYIDKDVKDAKLTIEKIHEGIENIEKMEIITDSEYRKLAGLRASASLLYRTLKIYPFTLKKLDKVEAAFSEGGISSAKGLIASFTMEVLKAELQSDFSAWIGNEREETDESGTEGRWPDAPTTKAREPESHEHDENDGGNEPPQPTTYEHERPKFSGTVIKPWVEHATEYCKMFQGWAELDGHRRERLNTLLENVQADGRMENAMALWKEVNVIWLQRTTNTKIIDDDTRGRLAYQIGNVADLEGATEISKEMLFLHISHYHGKLRDFVEFGVEKEKKRNAEAVRAFDDHFEILSAAFRRREFLRKRENYLWEYMYRISYEAYKNYVHKGGEEEKLGMPALKVPVEEELGMPAMALPSEEFEEL